MFFIILKLLITFCWNSHLTYKIRQSRNWLGEEGDFPSSEALRNSVAYQLRLNHFDHTSSFSLIFIILCSCTFCYVGRNIISNKSIIFCNQKHLKLLKRYDLCCTCWCKAVHSRQYRQGVILILNYVALYLHLSITADSVDSICLIEAVQD